jgi:hypothetical protein
MTDHAEAFDAAKLKDYVDECESLSDSHFRFVPGLEYECQARIHILGFGQVSLLETKDPREVINTINECGGISVIAHPPDATSLWIESFGPEVKGIEVWNTKYDGRYAPRPDVFALLKRLQKRSPSMRAYYGLDLHWKKQFRGLQIRLNCPDNARAEILSALASGNYQAIKGQLELPSCGHLPAHLLAQFGTTHMRSRQFRVFVKKCKQLLNLTGIHVPSPIKSQMRKLF